MAHSRPGLLDIATEIESTSPEIGDQTETPINIDHNIGNGTGGEEEEF